MNFKNIFRRESKIIVIAIACLSLVLIGGSYALFFQVKKNSNNQVVQAGDLTITYFNVNGTLDSSCLEPKTDDEGKATNGSCVFVVRVKNDGTLPMYYDLLIYDGNPEELSAEDKVKGPVDQNLVRFVLDKKRSGADIDGIEELKDTTAKTVGGLSTIKEGTDKKILETEVIKAGQTIEFYFKFWISDTISEESGNIEEVIDKYVYLKLGVEGRVDDGKNDIPSLLSDYIIGLTEKENSQIEKFSQTNTFQTDELKEFRYVGADVPGVSSVNNYVCFGTDVTPCPADNLYRIIGVIPTKNSADNGANYVRRVKLIKKNALTLTSGEVTNSRFAWGNSNNFATSSLKTKLNAPITDASGYLKTLVYEDTEKGITIDYTDYIDDSLWYLGASDTTTGSLTDASSITGDDLYFTERSDIVSGSNPKNYVGKVGLMYGSDYAFSIGSAQRKVPIYDNRTLYKSSWLYGYDNEWTLSSSSTEQNARSIVGLDYTETAGSLGVTGVTLDSLIVRPVFSLNANVKRVSGDGSSTNPFRLGR